MEPLFFKAENERPCFWLVVEPVASMEPLFFKAENRTKPGIASSTFDGASMEPLFFKAENKQSKGGGPKTQEKCFNGAAFFQSGK